MSYMVSKTMKICLLLCAALFALAACDRPFVLDLPLAVDSHEYTFSSKAGEARIFFYTTKQWTITLDPVDCSWASVNRISGDGQAPVEEILFTYEENQEADRKVTIVISAGELQEMITMSQTGAVRDWLDGSSGIDDLIVKPQY